MTGESFLFANYKKNNVAKRNKNKVYFLLFLNAKKIFKHFFKNFKSKVLKDLIFILNTLPSLSFQKYG